jgi:pteridine reductase
MKNAVIITGGAKRVGAAMAVYFAGKGFDIALHYNTSQNEALALQNEIKKTGVACEIFAHDLGDSKGLTKLIDSIHSKMPHCNTLINNASIFERCEFMETDEALFDRQFAINFKAPFFLTQEFARKFGKNPGANVINILDTDIEKNPTSHFAYLLSKKALADFTKMAAISLGPEIRINGVCPGILLPSNELDEEYMVRLAKTLPLRKTATVEQVVSITYELANNPALTGQLLFIDGGKNVL